MNKRRIGARRIIMWSLVSLTAAAQLALIIFGYLIPAPLAEYMAFSYTYALAGKTGLCVSFSVLFAMAMALSVIASTEKLGRTLGVKIAAAVAVGADLSIHSYVFLAASGYNWNYLASAAFDVILLVCILFPQGEKK